jgi:hypothetical protein
VKRIGVHGGEAERLSAAKPQNAYKSIRRRAQKPCPAIANRSRLWYNQVSIAARR